MTLSSSTVPNTQENWALAISLQAVPSVGREQGPSAALAQQLSSPPSDRTSWSQC